MANKVDSFFSMFKNMPPSKSYKRVSIEEYIDDVKKIYYHTGANPETFIKRLIDFEGDIDRELDKSKYYGIKFDNYRPSAYDTRQRAKEHLIKGKKITVQNYYEPSYEHIYNNIYPYVFRNNMEEGEILYFTYVLSTRGLVLGKFVDVFEMGTGHGYLVEEEEEDTVLCAGELLLFNNTLTFNFQSGSYMKNVELDKKPLWKAFLIEFTGKVLSSTPHGERKFDKVEYAEGVVFPSIFPTINSIKNYLRFPGNKMVMEEEQKDIDITRMIGNFKLPELEEGEIPNQEIFSISLDDAQKYFKHYPYQKVRIISEGIEYTNPYPHKPSLFLPVRHGKPTRWSFKSQKSTRKSTRKSRKVNKKGKSTRKSTRKSRKVNKKGKSTRKSTRKSRKLNKKRNK